MLITGGTSLPHGLSTTYTNYKRETSIAIKWLQDNGSELSEENTKITTCRRLLTMAENIRLKGFEAPREVLWALRDAIEGRKHLNKWMRDESGLVDAESNLRHEVFSDTLETIYDSLRATRSVKTIQPAKSQPPTSASFSTSSSPEPLLNRYEALYDDEPESDDGPETPTQDYQDTHAAPLPLPLPKKSKQPAAEDIDLDFDVMMDDMISYYVEAFMALVHLDSLLDVARSTWAKAGRGDIPYNVASALSRSIWSLAHDDLEVLTASPWSYNLKLWKLMLISLKSAGPPPVWSKKDMPSNLACTNGDGMLLGFYVLDCYQKKPSSPKTMPLYKDAFGKITAIANRDVDARAMLLMLQCMLDYRTWGDVENDYNLTPGIQMAQEWSEKPLPGRVRLAFYLRFLVECHRAYMFPDGKAAVDPSPTLIVPINPRVRTLKYVMELSQNYHEVSSNPYMQHCCGTALAGSLETFALELDGFTREPKYDLYFQNPFVAGDIMLHLNDIVRDYGKLICNHRHYVASVLHVYNALRCMEDIQAIPSLDELCAIFEDIIFLGERPRRNFSSIFTRHRGGVPQYGETSGQRGQDLGSNSMWAMKLHRKDVDNDNWEHKETNCHRFEESIDHSVFTKTTLDGSHGCDWYWAKVLGLNKWHSPSNEELQGITNWLQSHNLNDHPLHYVEGIIIAEFNGQPAQPASLPDQSPSDLTAGHICKDPRSKTFNITSCDHTYCKNQIPPTTPNIRLAPHRPTCSCVKNLPRPRVLARERVRGTGLLPVHRLNTPAIWMACATAFSKVHTSSKHKAADGSGDTEVDNPVTCLCLVDNLLMDADIWMDRSKKSMKYPGKKLKKKWIKAIEAGFKEVPAEEFLWKWL